MLPVYTITIFLSAVLLFLVQPMFARMIVPMLGGSPSVWNTAMLFYQATLLAGYAYAHFSIKWLGLRRQLPCQLALVLVVFVALPLGIPEGWTPPSDSSPVFWMLGLMAVAVGLPFFVISSTSPVLQRWFAASGHPASSDPYFLYAASNAGSLLALTAYPFLIEPSVGLGKQSQFWAAGYAGLALLIGACGFFMWRASIQLPRPAPVPANADGKRPPLAAWRRTRWVALAFVPSSLMLSVTTYLSSEVASVPLLWVFPLTLYLATFTLVFARRPLISHALALRMFPMGIVALAMLLTMRATHPFFLLALVHLAGFFLVAMACHGELAKDRPEPGHLTEFYLWLAVGGAAGGLFNALLAPVLLDSVAEYPLGLVIACFLVVPTLRAARGRRDQVLDLGLPLGLGIVTLLLVIALPRHFGMTGSAMHAVVFGPPVVLCYFLSESRIRFGSGLAAIFVASTFYGGETGRTLFADRSFYGVHRVTISPDGRFHLLIHGSTVHGMQRRESEQLPTPLSYYYPTGPAGEFFASFRGRIDGPVAAIGMGAGALASYGRPGQDWTFYEIDPVVAELAGNSAYFSYLDKSPANLKVVLGDGRLSLSREEDGRFQLLIVDAFSSDTVPMHMLTREAMDLYTSKLRSDGIILFHISSRHFDLKPVLADLALNAGLICYSRDGTQVLQTEQEDGMNPSEWMVIARNEKTVQPIARLPEWKRIRLPSGRALWTDDRASLLEALF
jgi:hypothetical protein